MRFLSFIFSVFSPLIDFADAVPSTLPLPLAALSCTLRLVIFLEAWTRNFSVLLFFAFLAEPRKIAARKGSAAGCELAGADSPPLARGAGAGPGAGAGAPAAGQSATV